MDTILKVTFNGDMQAEQFYKAVANTDNVEIVTKYNLAYRIQGTQEAIEEDLDDTLKQQQKEDAKYKQHEFAKANKNARSQLRSAINENK